MHRFLSTVIVSTLEVVLAAQIRAIGSTSYFIPQVLLEVLAHCGYLRAAVYDLRELVARDHLVQICLFKSSEVPRRVSAETLRHV